jgi:hypothetical protein
MSPDVDWYDAAMKTLPADKRELAQNAELYRDLVKSEVWTGGDMVFAPGGNKALYAVENFMKIPVGGWEDWVEMESKFVKPVHEKNIALGNRAGWVLTYMVAPQGADQPYDCSTVDLYDKWEDMDNEQDGKAWEAIYPGMSDAHIGKRIEATRTLARSEIRRWVMGTE